MEGVFIGGGRGLKKNEKRKRSRTAKNSALRGNGRFLDGRAVSLKERREGFSLEGEQRGKRFSLQSRNFLIGMEGGGKGGAFWSQGCKNCRVWRGKGN